MALTYTYTISNGSPLDATEVMANFDDAKDYADTTVQLTGAQTIAGNKTFSGIVIVSDHIRLAEISTPTGVADNALLYAKDFSGETALCVRCGSGDEIRLTSGTTLNGSPTVTTGADTELENGQSITITHADDSTYVKRDYAFYKYETDHWEEIVASAAVTIQLFATTTVITNVSMGTKNVLGWVAIYS